MRRPISRGLGWTFTLAALAVLAALGAAVATPFAQADGLPTLPVSPPSLPLPPSPPPVTTPTLPLDAGTTTGPDASGGATATSPPAAAERAPSVAGAVQLRGGRRSIPETSVFGPAYLVIGPVRIVPKVIRARRQRLMATVRVSESRGYLVRGVRLELSSLPAGRLRTLAAATTGLDGSAHVALQTTVLLPYKAGARLVILIRARGSSARRLVSVPVLPRR